MEEDLIASDGKGVQVSLFNYSVDDYFKTIDAIAKLCEEPESEGLDESNVQRISSSITFLREWRYFNYGQRTIRFADEIQSCGEKRILSEINLPQFSSAAVPKKDMSCAMGTSLETSKDFVMYVGGSVWAIDWCPRFHERPERDIKCEFIAVAAHPPESYYHKLGAAVTGRGIIQIWCMLNVGGYEEEALSSKKNLKLRTQNDETTDDKAQRPRRRPRKKPIDEDLNNKQLKRPRGRPRKKPRNESTRNLDGGDLFVQPLAIQPPENLPTIQEVTGNTQDENLNNEQLKRPRGRPRNKPRNESTENLDGGDEFVQPLAVQHPEDLLTIKEVTGNTQDDTVEKNLDRKKQILTGSSLNSPVRSRRLKSKASVKKYGDDGCREIDEALDNDAMTDKITQLKRPKRRPIKKPRDEFAENLDGSDHILQSLASQHPEETVELLTIQEVSGNTKEDTIQKKHDRRKRTLTDSSLKTSISRRLKSNTKKEKYADDKCQQLLNLNEDKGACTANHQMYPCSEQNSVVCNNVTGNGLSNTSLDSCSISGDIALPRVVLCLAHNGKVAWDVKWKPYNENDCKCKQRMGYLAVLLGNGSLEVWDVPLLHTVKAIYLSSIKEGTDPRFVKLEPVFRCSILKCGGIQSIPLTVEWSTSPPHDYLLAGCHDGMVALWKFVASGSSKDTRPLLCFTADTAPIRAISWAPCESDPERANVILTAGHGRIKFWDLRDPFRPLWDLHPAPRFIYGLDWSADPRCVILSFDDGAIRILSLAEAAYDVPATGKPFTGTKQQGLHLVYCSSFTIWSIQVSRLTGMVAYCNADGTVLRFQLTTKAVEKDHTRNRPLHFQCGSLTEDESAITVNTPIEDTPVASKKLVHDGAERCMRRLLIESNPTKSANNKKGKRVLSSDNQPLAICYGNNPGEESDDDVTLASLKEKKEPKSRSSSKKKAGDDRALVRIDEEMMDVRGKENEKGEAGNGTDVLPPKIAAMHRVRWNMNKGSERWLCYGGAAGIVRCQAVRVPVVHQKPTRR